jgi:hypothetical protein
MLTPTTLSGCQENLPALVCWYESFFVKGVCSTAAAPPLLGSSYRSARDRIPVHVFELLDVLGRAPHTEIVEPKLPKPLFRLVVLATLTLLPTLGCPGFAPSSGDNPGSGRFHAGFLNHPPPPLRSSHLRDLCENQKSRFRCSLRGKIHLTAPLAHHVLPFPLWNQQARENPLPPRYFLDAAFLLPNIKEAGQVPDPIPLADHASGSFVL